MIAEVGDGVTGWAVGQEVCALLAGGGYAEYVAVPAGQVMPIPDGVDAASRRPALPEVACTVWSNLVMTAHLAAGQTAADPRRRQRHRHPRASRWHARWAPGSRSPRARRTSSTLCGELGADDHDQLPRRGLRRAGQRGDRRRRRRDPRHHGRGLPRPQCRRAGARRPAGHHRHAGRRQGANSTSASCSPSAPA